MYKRSVVLFVLGLVGLLSGAVLWMALGGCLFVAGALDVAHTHLQLRRQRLDTAWQLTADLLDGAYFPTERTRAGAHARHISATVEGVGIDILHELPGEQPYTLVSATVAAPPGWWTFLPAEHPLIPATHPMPESFELRCSEDGVYAVSDTTVDEAELLLEASHAVAGLASEAQGYHPWSALASSVNGQLQHDPVAHRWTLELPNRPENMLVEVTRHGSGYRTEAQQCVRGGALSPFALHRRDTLSLPLTAADVTVGEYVLTGEGARHVRGQLQAIAPLLKAARPLSLQADHDRVTMTWGRIIERPETLHAARKVMRTVARARQQSPYRTAAA